MAWSVIRKATKDDTSRLFERANKFRWKHIPPEAWSSVDSNDCPASDIEEYIGQLRHMSRGHEAARLRKNWRRVLNRALRTVSADGIVDGYIGFCVP